MKKKVYYHKKNDILYFFLKEGKQYDSEEISPGITLELGKNGEHLGIEILNASKSLGKLLDSKRSYKKSQLFSST